jgi:hypothetical protein
MHKGIRGTRLMYPCAERTRHERMWTPEYEDRLMIDIGIDGDE